MKRHCKWIPIYPSSALHAATLVVTLDLKASVFAVVADYVVCPEASASARAHIQLANRQAKLAQGHRFAAPYPGLTSRRALVAALKGPVRVVCDFHVAAGYARCRVIRLDIGGVTCADGDAPADVL